MYLLLRLMANLTNFITLKTKFGLLIKAKYNKDSIVL